MASEDPFYSRKPVPSEFVEHIGDTGLSRETEFLNRERKYSLKGGDVRNFSNPGSGKNKDPFYQRKPVDLSLVGNVGPTGMTKAEEFAVRERKYSLPDGSDARRFSTSKTGGYDPPSDPFYGRKPVATELLEGVGESGKTKAEEYEIRERKQSLFQLSDDPFAQLAGRNRQSISGESGAVAAQAFRRKSSAMAGGDAAKANAAHSGYHGNQLGSIDQRPELPPVNVGDGLTTADRDTDAINHHPGHVPTHFEATNDPDHVAPNEVR